MSLVSIGEFARRSRLSPKALRLYDELGLLVPAEVDAETGYRWYADWPVPDDQADEIAARFPPLARAEACCSRPRPLRHGLSRRP